MKSSGAADTLSHTALDFEVLPEPLQALLAEAVDEYVIAVEEGCQPDRNAFLNKFEPVRFQLSAYLDHIDWLHDESAAGSRPQSELSRESSTGLAYDDFEIGPEIGRARWGLFTVHFRNRCSDALR